MWVDVRVIAATNKDLDQEIKNRNFRQDLYYRLGVITLTLPPLRRRKEDIPDMAQHFLVQHSQQVGREIAEFSQEAIHAMCNYAWPGNVRELMNVIERAVLLCRSGRIVLEDLPAGFRENQELSLEWPETGKTDPADWSGQTLDQVKTVLITQVEKTYLEMVLKKTRGRVGEAARKAGIHPRGLYEKMKKLGIDKNQFKPGQK